MANKNKTKKAWNFQGAEDGVVELLIYGEISATADWDSGEISLESFTNELNWATEDRDVKELVIRINSAGGDVFTATAIYTRLKAFPAKKTVKIDGWAASAATIIAMAGDVIEIAPNGAFMIHNPLFGLEGYYNAGELGKLIEQLDVIKKSIINAYIEKTGKTAEEINELMAAETWYTGQEAVDAGFCDKVMFQQADVAALADEIIINGISTDRKVYSVPRKVLNQFHHAGNDFNINNKTNAESGSKGEDNMDNEKTGQEVEVKEIKAIEELREAYPDLVEELEEAAKKEERERLEEIDEIATPGTEEIINKAKYKSYATAGQVAIEILNAQKAKGDEYLNGRKEDVNGANFKDVKGQGDPGAKKGKNEFLEAIDKVLPKK